MTQNPFHNSPDQMLTGRAMRLAKGTAALSSPVSALGLYGGRVAICAYIGGGGAIEFEDEHGNTVGPMPVATGAYVACGMRRLLTGTTATDVYFVYTGDAV